MYPSTDKFKHLHTHTHMYIHIHPYRETEIFILDFRLRQLLQLSLLTRFIYLFLY